MADSATEKPQAELSQIGKGGVIYGDNQRKSGDHNERCGFAVSVKGRGVYGYHFPDGCGNRSGFRFGAGAFEELL